MNKRETRDISTTKSERGGVCKGVEEGSYLSIAETKKIDSYGRIIIKIHNCSTFTDKCNRGN